MLEIVGLGLDPKMEGRWSVQKLSHAQAISRLTKPQRVRAPSRQVLRLCHF